MTHTKSPAENVLERRGAHGPITRFERACLAHRLHEEIEQTLIGISLDARAHAQRLKLTGSIETKAAVRIQRLLERNILRLDRLIKALDEGKPR